MNTGGIHKVKHGRNLHNTYEPCYHANCFGKAQFINHEDNHLYCGECAILIQRVENIKPVPKVIFLEFLILPLCGHPKCHINYTTECPGCGAIAEHTALNSIVKSLFFK